MDHTPHLHPAGTSYEDSDVFFVSFVNLTGEPQGNIQIGQATSLKDHL